MRCKKVMEELSDYLDGVLDAALKEDLCAHLSKCHHCQVVVDTTRKTIDLYCDGEVFPLPTDVHERLHSVIRRKCQQQTT